MRRECGFGGGVVMSRGRGRGVRSLCGVGRPVGMLVRMRDLLGYMIVVYSWVLCVKRDELGASGLWNWEV